MKIAVYSLCKNEAANVSQFLNCADEADQIIVVDTGSVDRTVELLRQSDRVQLENVQISPWRFDHARNYALGLVAPDTDLAVWLDFDEYFQPGWRTIIESQFEIGVDRYSNLFKNTVSGSEYKHFKIHTLNGARWKYPIHEQLVYDRMTREKFIPDLVCYHSQDDKKDRGFYISMLETYLQSGELPQLEYAPLLVREYFINKNYGRVIEYFETLERTQVLNHLSRAKLANSYRYYITAHLESGLQPSADLIAKGASIYPTRDHLYVAAWAYRRIGEYQRAMDCLSLGDASPEIDFESEFVQPNARGPNYENLRKILKVKMAESMAT